MKKLLTLLILSLASSAILMAEDWTDVTSAYITNPYFDGNSNAGWNIEASSYSTDCNYEVQEFWNGTWNIYQAKEVANGKYRLYVSAFHRPGNFSEDDARNWESQEITSFLYANDYSIPLNSIYSQHLTEYYNGGWWAYTPEGEESAWIYPNNMEAASTCFYFGMYENMLEFEVTDGTLTFGIKNETSVEANWTIMDNWRLEFSGTAIYVESITLSETQKNLEVGEQFQLTATVSPENAMSKDVSWTSSNESVALVDADGNVEALREGTAIITATATDGSGASASCTVTVAALSLPEDGQWLDVTSLYINNPNFDNNSNDWWNIENNSYSRDCDFEAQEFWYGTWNIYQTTSLPQGYYRISVNAYHRHGSFSEYDAANWESMEITSLLYANSYTQPLKSVYSEYIDENYKDLCWGYYYDGFTHWYPDRMESGAYCFEQGMYKNEMEFYVAGETLTFGIKNDTYVDYNWCLMDNWKLEYFGDDVVFVESVALDPTSLSLAVEEEAQLTATVLPENASVKNVSWTSSDESVATVDADGNVKALREGTATITVVALDGSGAQATCVVTVHSNTPDASNLLITEIQSANIDQYVDPSWNYGGWVELYNPSGSSVTLTGCWVSDDASNLKKVHITEPMAVPAGGYLNLWFDHHDKYCPTQIDLKLDVEGGTIYISDSNGTLIASQSYPEAVSRCSYARKSLTSDEWAWTSAPTPEAANEGSTYCEARLEAPYIDHDSQIFSTTLTVCVNIPEGATLRYTTDGSAPTATNGETSLTGLFYPDATTVYRFCLVQDGYLPSPVVTRTYIYKDKEFALPVFSVVTANENLYSNELGIFVQGVNGRPGNGQSSACNWNMDWDRPANFEFINTNGEMVVNQETGMERAGGWSRAWTPYSFKVKANKLYEQQNYLPYDFFEEKPYLRHRTLQMRNGGNDNTCRIKDPALQEIVLRSGIDVNCQAYEPVMHYINGRYAGTINMREPNNKHYVYTNYGLDDDEIDQFEMSPDSGYVQKCGTYESMQRWYDLAEKCSDALVYEQIKEMVDIDEYCNYMAVEFFLGSYDWPQNNVKGWKPIMDGGKYRFVLYDLDGAFSSTNSFYDFAGKQTYTFDQLYGEPVNNITKEIEMVTIFLNMLKNDDFRKQFIDSYCLVVGSVFEPSRCQEIITELCNNVKASQAIYNEVYNTSSSPWGTANDLIYSISSSRQSTMINTLKDYWQMDLGSTTAQNVTLSANISEARLLVDDLPVPTNKFDGQLFAPITFKAQAPAGYRFDGWKMVSGTVGTEDTVLERGSTWSYYDQGSLDAEDWKNSAYNYGSWNSGKAPLGYCNGDTLTTNLNKNLTTYYFATNLTLDAAPESDETFTLDYTVDDGFVIYVNGKEAGRYNMPSGTVTYDTYATTFANGNPDSGTMTLSTSLFQEGTNYIAVEVHNNDYTSSDIYWDASILHNSNKATGEYVCYDEEYDMPTTTGSMTLQACYSEMSDEEKEDEEITTTPIVINEVSAGNSINVNEYYKKDDWVELYNTTSSDIDLEGMYMTDNSSKPQKYQITAAGTKASTLIPAHGYKVIWCSERETDTELHANFKLSNNDGKLVRIAAADDSWADSLIYCAHNGDQSVGRYPDGGRDIYLMTTPTIKASNTMTTYAALWEYQDTIAADTTGIETDVRQITSRSGGMSIACVGDYLLIKSEDSPHVTLGVYTAGGMTVMYRKLNIEDGHERVSIAALPRGVYIARARDDEGNECATKFIKN